MNQDFLSVISQIKNIKKTETTLPIARLAANITPLMVGDDLSLRSSITSPSGYDREMIKLLHNKVEFIHEEKTYTEPYDKFCNQISNIDKLALIWALYKCTYESLGERLINCPKCKDNNNKTFQFKQEIIVEELLNNDSLTLWEEETPFYEYIFPVIVPYANLEFCFMTLIPSMARYNQLLGMVSTGELQNNLEKLGQVFTKPMQMSLLTKSISIKENDVNQVESKSLQEVMIAFDNHIPETVSDKFYNSYNDKFNKYLPKFYKEVSCPNCGHKFNYDVDIETEFFRRSVLGSE